MGQRLGQHFLIKGSILERIAVAVCPNPVDLVIEIGPGRGALTERLLSRAQRVVAIEIDPFLVDYLRGRFQHQAQVVHANVLETDLSQWGGVPIVGNLPYYITSPILEKVVRRNFPRAVFLIQKEVAERLVAEPGTRDYGYLTVQTAVFSHVRLLFHVKRSAFHPPPKVESAVVLLEPRPPITEDPESFLRFAGACFKQKRKTLRNNLAPIYGKEVDSWSEAGLRAEQLPLEKLVELFNRIRPIGGPRIALPRS